MESDTSKSKQIYCELYIWSESSTGKNIEILHVCLSNKVTLMGANELKNTKIQNKLQ